MADLAAQAAESDWYFWVGMDTMALVGLPRDAVGFTCCRGVCRRCAHRLEKVMRKIIVALLAVMLAAGPAVASDVPAGKKRKAEDGRHSRSPSAIAERQRHKSTFDETQYYERLSEKIPFGSAAWWRQRLIEDANE